MRLLAASLAAFLAFLAAMPALAQSSLSIKLSGESGQHSRASVSLRSLYGATLVTGVRTSQDNSTVYAFELPEAAWIGGFARLEVTVEGIQLPAGDAYAGRNIDVVRSGHSGCDPFGKDGNRVSDHFFILAQCKGSICQCRCAAGR